MSKSKFVRLKCPNCNKTLDVSLKDFEDLFTDLSRRAIFFGPQPDHYTCGHCKTEFPIGTRFNRLASGSGVNIGDGVNLNVGGDIIGGDKRTVIYSDDNIVIYEPDDDNDGDDDDDF